jgi:circadian clock protein KaiA
MGLALFFLGKFAVALASPLQIHLLADSQDSQRAIETKLDTARYGVSTTTSPRDCLDYLQGSYSQVDCLVLEASLLTDELWEELSAQGLLLPTVVILKGRHPEKPSFINDLATSLDVPETLRANYHGAIIALSAQALGHLENAIRQAIQGFLALPSEHCMLPDPVVQLPNPTLLTAQQERLTDKLKARLGYLGVYYKRNPDNFLRHMSQADRNTFLKELKAEYRRIVLSYFANDPKLNQTIDDFVNEAFMVDIPVSHIVEMHMELMDEFSKQLKLEGRSEEILLDYRLTLIDVIAHLCEMYRRSIPREPSGQA